MPSFPIFVLIYALYEGFLHAFEADHVLAVSNIVSQRERITLAIKDGLFWGLGHTSMIFLIGILMILFKVHISEGSFSWFEAAVGAMLIFVAVCRFYFFMKEKPIEVHVHRHEHEHPGENKHTHLHVHGKHLHKTSYGIGLVHGLAGSGALVLLIMTQIQTVAVSLLYLTLFGLGSMIGMACVAGIFSVPFSRQLFFSRRLTRMLLILLSSGLCFCYGVYVIYQNLCG